MRITAIAAVGILVLISAILTAPGNASADASVDHASCMGLGSSFYARFATQQRAHVAHLVKEYFAEVPGEYLRDFAQEKEGGSIPSPCGTAIE
jgi:hypothetical protein